MSTQKENGLDTLVSTPATGLDDFINAVQKEILQPVPTKEEIRKAELIENVIKSQITLDSEFDKPEPFLYYNHFGKDLLFGSLGNFSAIQGKAKSKKTYLTSILCGAFLNPNSYTLGVFKSAVEDNKRNLVYFDTEMGSVNVQDALKRIYKLSKLSKEDFTDRVTCIPLRPCGALEKLEIIDTYLSYLHEQGKEFGLVVIDGIADLITNINDYEQGDKAGAYLLKWTYTYNCHITTIIHENKGDENPRGHLGTTILNKSELILKLKVNEVDKSISTMSIPTSRNELDSLGIEFSFQRTEEDIPTAISTDLIPVKSAGATIKKSVSEDMEIHHFKNLVERFINKYPKGVNKTTLAQNLNEHLKALRLDKEYRIGINDIKRDIDVFTDNYNLFRREGNTKTSKYFLNENFTINL